MLLNTRSLGGEAAQLRTLGSQTMNFRVSSQLIAAILIGACGGDQGTNGGAPQLDAAASPIPSGPSESDGAHSKDPLPSTSASSSASMSDSGTATGVPHVCAGTKHKVDPLWKLAAEGGSWATCPARSRIPGTRAAGEACEHPNDCAPVCCACGVPGNNAFASYCREGRCAPADDVCCGLAGSVTKACGG